MDFTVDEIHTGPIAAPRLDRSMTPYEWRFRTRIRKGAPDGPNYAGHYTVITWGCGVECQMHAIVDAKTGGFVRFRYLSAMGLGHNLKSRLLVVNPSENALVENGPFLSQMLKHYGLFERTYLDIKEGAVQELCKENAAIGIRATK
jgi:hypothetical protein